MTKQQIFSRNNLDSGSAAGMTKLIQGAIVEAFLAFSCQGEPITNRH